MVLLRNEGQKGTRDGGSICRERRRRLSLEVRAAIDNEWLAYGWRQPPGGMFTAKQPPSLAVLKLPNYWGN